MYISIVLGVFVFGLNAFIGKNEPAKPDPSPVRSWIDSSAMPMIRHNPHWLALDGKETRNYSD